MYSTQSAWKIASKDEYITANLAFALKTCSNTSSRMQYIFNESFLVALIRNYVRFAFPFFKVTNFHLTESLP
jgi:hypothetical protein